MQSILSQLEAMEDLEKLASEALGIATGELEVLQKARREGFRGCESCFGS